VAVAFPFPAPVWKGRKGIAKTRTASIEAIITGATEDAGLHYRLAFTKTKSGFRFEITDELLESEPAYSVKRLPEMYYKFENGRPVLTQKGVPSSFLFGDVNPQVSIMAFATRIARRIAA